MPTIEHSDVPEEHRDNVAAFAIGAVQVGFGFFAPWVSVQYGIEFLALLGLVVLVGFVGTFWVYRMDPSDRRGIITIVVLSLIAIAVAFTLSLQEDTETRRPEIIVKGQVFIDRNRNGVKDGTDEPAGAVEVAVRDRFGHTQNRVSDSAGKVRFTIPEQSEIQIVACGVAQSHQLNELDKVPNSLAESPTENSYQITIGIELTDLKNCVVDVQR